MVGYLKVLPLQGIYNTGHALSLLWFLSVAHVDFTSCGYRY